MNILAIYLIIGVSNYIHHLTYCRNCRYNIANVLAFFAEMAVHFGLWPKDLYRFTVKLFEKVHETPSPGFAPIIERDDMPKGAWGLEFNDDRSVKALLRGTNENMRSMPNPFQGLF